MGEVQSSAPSDSQQKLAALAQRGSNADAVQTVSNMGLAINAAQVTAAGTSAWAAGTFQCFAGRVIAPLGGAMLGGALAEALGADRPVTWVLDKMGLPAVAKPGKAPARVGHKIVHENAFIGALTGLLAGIAVGVAIAAAPPRSWRRAARPRSPSRRPARSWSGSSRARWAVSSARQWPRASAIPAR